MHRADGPLPIEVAARRAMRHAGRVLLDDIHRVEYDLSKLTHHARYDHQQTPTSPEAPDVSVTDIEKTIKDDAEAAVAKIRGIIDNHLPSLIGDAKAVEGNAVFVSLTKALHVPSQYLQIAANLIDDLAAKFPAEAASEPTSEPVDAPQPVAAGPVVAGQA